MQKQGNTSLFFLYDTSGLFGFDLITNGSTTGTYYYRTDGKGEIIALTDSAGNVVANYTYDAWGFPTGITDASGNAITSSTHIGIVNPIRYKGYCYDTETGLYYLNSRYYDPEVCRFINADGIIDSGCLIGTNLYAYSLNNPVNKIDPSGHFPIAAALAVTNWWNPVGWIAAAVIVVTAVAIVSHSISETASAVKASVEAIDNITNTKDQSIYVLTDSTEKVRYVGRTNNPTRREYEHKHDPKHPERQSYNMNVVATGLNVPQAKIAEQVLISAYTIEYLDNARREIAIGNLIGYREHMSAIIQIYESIPEDELMNLMGR